MNRGCILCFQESPKVLKLQASEEDMLTVLLPMTMVRIQNCKKRSSNFTLNNAARTSQEVCPVSSLSMAVLDKILCVQEQIKIYARVLT